jgi:hypothetical protein
MTYMIHIMSLTDEQLVAFALIDPAAAKAEQGRRLAYPDRIQFHSELAQAVLNLERSLGALRFHTMASEALQQSGLLDVVRRGLIDQVYAEPTLDGV